MDLHWLKPLLGRPAPFTTVYLDSTAADTAGGSDALDRWHQLRRDLEVQGAPVSVMEDIGELVSQPTGVAGAHGRVIVADAEGVRVDRILAAPPAQSQATLGLVPVLLPAAQAADESTRFLLVEADRQGADLSWSDWSGAKIGEAEVVDGDHDVLHKVREGGSSQRRLETRAEDSWERNAEVVAAELDRVVSERVPELVLLTGDIRAVGLVREAVGQHVRERLVVVPGGSRADGVNGDAFRANVEDALRLHRMRRREQVLEQYRTGTGRGEGAATALADVVDVLRRGQVSELVVARGAVAPGAVLRERQLWIGPDPLDVALTGEELASMGVQGETRIVPADVALVRAAVAQDAGLTFADDGSIELVDGVGAVLRWTDSSTPSASVLSQSADTARLRNVG
ncbi:Vms1/Ankzf1 family peptidyl-tRNA hydrolase [Cellulomonas sp. P22]|uniref:baeRF2 domain-containing protein n=1 Tax=Cellulomonas sp. P22 TaxID=3373189 RepID=UPI00378DEC32